MDYSKAQELMKLKQEMEKIQKELENTIIEAESDGLVVSINCNMKVEKVDIEDNTLVWDADRMKIAVKEATNKGYKKAQEIAAQKMQGAMSSMGIDPSALGM